MVYVGKLCVEHLLKPVFTLVQAGVSCEWAYDSQRFLLEFFDTIHNSPSQIYHFALPLCPPSSWLSKCYGAELLQGPKMVKGLPAGWGSCSRTVVLEYIPQTLAYWKDTIAVGFKSSDIIILDVITGSQLAVLSGHIDWVTSLNYSLDGTFLVSGSADATLKLWDVQTGGVVKTFHGHTHSIYSVSISLDCAMVASGSSDSTLRLWDVQTGECHCIISQSQSVECVCFSPTNSQHLISISGGIVQQWDTNGHQIKLAYKGFDAAFSLDGTHLVLCGEEVTTVQNSDSGAIVIKCPTGRSSKYCCFSPNGRLIAVATGVTASVWDITGLVPHLIETFIGHTYDIDSLTFSSSSSLISVSGDSSVKFWQIGASSTDSVAGDPKSTPSTSASIQSVSLQANNGIAISSDSDGGVKTWDLSTGLCKASFQTLATGRVFRDAQIMNSGLVAVWLGDGGIHIWDSKKGGLPQVIKTTHSGAKDLRISRDGSKVFLLSERSIQAWSMHTGEAVGEVELEGGSYLDLLYMSGSRISVHFPNSLSQGWDFGISGSSPVPLPNMYLEGPHLDFIGGACWRYQGPSWIKNTATGKEVFRLSGRYARPYEVEWDGQYLVAGYESGELLILDFIQILPQ
jgi:WD40 repeat protein